MERWTTVHHHWRSKHLDKIKNWLNLLGRLLALSAFVAVTNNGALAMSNQQLNQAASEFSQKKLPDLCLGKEKFGKNDGQSLGKILMSNGLNESRQFNNTMGEYFVYSLMFYLAEGMALSCPKVDRVTAIQNFVKSFENRP